MLDKAADWNTVDVAARWKRPRQGEADVDQRRAAQAGHVGNRSPHGRGNVTVRLRPDFTAGDPHQVEDAYVLVLWSTGDGAFGGRVFLVVMRERAGETVGLDV